MVSGGGKWEGVSGNGRLAVSARGDGRQTRGAVTDRQEERHTAQLGPAPRVVGGQSTHLRRQIGLATCVGVVAPAPFTWPTPLLTGTDSGLADRDRSPHSLPTTNPLERHSPLSTAGAKHTASS